MVRSRDNCTCDRMFVLVVDFPIVIEHRPTHRGRSVRCANRLGSLTNGHKIIECIEYPTSSASFTAATASLPVGVAMLVVRKTAAMVSILSFVGLLGCGSPNSLDDNIVDSSEDAATLCQQHDEKCILIIVFREILPNRKNAEFLAGFGKGEVFFLAHGYMNEKWLEPPEYLITQFLDELGVCIKPVSEATRSNSSSNPGEPFLLDKETGKRGRLFYVEIIRWIDDQTVEVVAGSIAAPLAGKGGTFVLRKKRDEWIIIEIRDRWIS